MSLCSPRMFEVRKLAPLRVVLLLALSIGAAAPAFAQGNKDPHWGAGVSFTPTWKAHQKFQDLLLVEGDRLEGSEVTIGVVRGSTRGGDWGVSFVRKPIKNGTTLVSIDEFSDVGFLSRTTQTLVFRDVYYKGVEGHVFIPFVTIKDRVQIGVNVGGGVATVKGTIEETLEFFSQFTFPNGQVQTNSERETFTQDAADVVYRYQPLIKLEAQGAIILAPAAKIKISGGLNAPSGGSFRIGAVFLIGAR